jgi:hypothetical protein
MVELTILELHFDVDAGDLPFGGGESSMPDGPTEDPTPRRSARAASGLGERVPIRLLVGVAVLVLVLAVGAAAAKLLGDDDDLAEAF